jgi:hypothetical protein
MNDKYKMLETEEGREGGTQKILSKNLRAAGLVESYMRELGSIPGWL